MFGRSTQNTKRDSIKKGITAEDARRKREDMTNEIRKNKRDAQMEKRRMIAPVSASTTSTPQADVPLSISSLQHYTAQVNSNDYASQLEGTVQFRKLLSLERNPPINEVIKCGVVPRLVQFLSMHHLAKLQFEAAWALTNIASGNAEQTRVLVDNGAVPVFVQLLSSADDELREQAVWAIGNIAGDSSFCRDTVLHHGAMQPLLRILNSNSNKESMQRNATWTLSNLCRGKPAPQFSMVAVALPTLQNLIHSTDQEVLIDACWALSYLSDGSNSNIQTVLNSGVAPRLVQLLAHSSPSVQTPALRTVGNIVTGDDSQTQKMLDLGILPMLYQLLQSNRKTIKKEAAWTISNITAGNGDQTQQVINANIIPLVINLLGNSEFDVKKEAAWAISNATTWKSRDQIHYMVGAGCIKPLCDLLSSKDAKLLGVVLEALENILCVGENITKNNNGNPYTTLIEECEGLDKLEELQQHANEEIYKRSLKMLENYFNAEEEDQNMAPNVNASQQTYNFGFNAPTATAGFSF